MHRGIYHTIQVFALCVIIGIIIAISVMMWPKSMHISYKQVQHEIAVNSDSVTSKLVLPQSIKTWNTQSIKVLNGWLKGLTEDEAQFFINNLHDILEEAQSDSSADINAVVNTYKQMYLSEIAKRQADSLDKTFKLIFIMIGILKIMLILVLLRLYSIVMNVKTITEAVLDIDQIGTAIHDQAIIED